MILPPFPVTGSYATTQCGTNLGLDNGPPTYLVGDMLLGVFNPSPNGTTTGSTTFGNNNLYSKSNVQNPIGVTYQTCIMAQYSALSTVPLDTWNCQWVLGFSSIPQINQIMAQGNYYNVSRSSNPVDQTPPPYQYVSVSAFYFNTYRTLVHTRMPLFIVCYTNIHILLTHKFSGHFFVPYSHIKDHRRHWYLW